MGSSLEIRLLKSNLQNKGFEIVTDRDHTFYYFIYKGKKLLHVLKQVVMERQLMMIR